MALSEILNIIVSDEKDIGSFDLFANRLSDLVNTFNMSKVYSMVEEEVNRVYNMDNYDKRFIDFAINWILCFADSYNKGNYDERDAVACKECKLLRTSLIVYGIIGSMDICRDNRIIYSADWVHRTLIQSATQVVLYAMIKQAELTSSTGILKAVIETTPDIGIKKNVDYALKHYTSMPLI